MAISLGSNLGDRRAHLEYASTHSSSTLPISPSHRFWKQSPSASVPSTARILNAVIVGRTQLSARVLLERLLEIEEERGRARPYPMAPRTLDLDLILYGDDIIEEDGLAVPHPRFRERGFVLRPLAEIAPEMIDPVTRTNDL